MFSWFSKFSSFFDSYIRLKTKKRWYIGVYEPRRAAADTTLIKDLYHTCGMPRSWDQIYDQQEYIWNLIITNFEPIVAKVRQGEPEAQFTEWIMKDWKGESEESQENLKRILRAIQNTYKPLKRDTIEEYEEEFVEYQIEHIDERVKKLIVNWTDDECKRMLNVGYNPMFQDLTSLITDSPDLLDLDKYRIKHERRIPGTSWWWPRKVDCKFTFFRKELTDRFDVPNIKQDAIKSILIVFPIDLQPDEWTATMTSVQNIIANNEENLRVDFLIENDPNNFTIRKNEVKGYVQNPNKDDYLHFVDFEIAENETPRENEKPDEINNFFDRLLKTLDYLFV